MTLASLDVVEFARALVRRPSVTPIDAGALGVMQAALEPLGFHCRRLPFAEVDNLYARRGSAGPNLCFAGHTDVVPPGEEAAWTHPPFGAEVADGLLYGRGAADMKGGIAAWTAAVAAVLARGEVSGSLSLLITGDEEGPADNGTKRVVEQLRAEGERIDACVVGEPSSVLLLGDTVKVGRRGSLNAWITARGVQGHVAYPERAANPVPVLIELLAALQARRLDEGHPPFPRSNLEVTSVDVGNPAGNVIPAEATARLNIRFNPAHTGDTLAAWLKEACARTGRDGVSLEVRSVCSGNAFMTEPGPFTEQVSAAVQEVLGRTPAPSTGGGTSDARFLRAMAPVVEIGLVGATIHQTDERVAVADLRALQRVYERVIERFFAAAQ
ncbi:MAG: succinyl-diaminopimelate desuccinylase [Proteobacteria bacterium]|nr:succinyl-diaminopimelate desuccinylase [Pseudomonadota bacterium]